MITGNDLKKAAVAAALYAAAEYPTDVRARAALSPSARALLAGAMAFASLLVASVLVDGIEENR